MATQQFGSILARTDPFDVAQAVERHVRTLSAEDIRQLVAGAAPRMNASYRAEFWPLVDEPDEHRVQTAFAHSLKSNLRALPLFGAAFCEGVIHKIPTDRAVGVGEEAAAPRALRPAVLAVVAVLLFLAGAAAQHVLTRARTNAEGPVVLVTPAPIIATPVHVASVRTPPPRRTPRVQPPPRLAPTQLPPPPAVRVAGATGSAALAATAAPSIRPQATQPGKRQRAAKPRPAPQPMAATPSPAPSPVDVSDMPQSYSDATPLPNVTAAPARIVARVRLATPSPTPAPRRRSWLHRTIMHLDPFKPNPRPTPS